jgi:hypothetical protein
MVTATRTRENGVENIGRQGGIGSHHDTFIVKAAGKNRKGKPVTDSTNSPEDEDQEEAQGATGAAALMRGKGRRKMESMTSLAEAVVDAAARSVRCTVITEGLGNSRDRHFYGPEALNDIVRLLNGAKAYVNHQTAAEAASRPEGDLRALAGYWRDATLTEVGGKLGVMATLVCDSSPAGEEVLAKATHALQFAREFPGLAEVYAGISINGDGEVDPREVTTDQGPVQANYVTKVTELPSADVVTRPAREGRFLTLVESIRTTEDAQEAMTMTKEGIKDSFKRIAEALGLVDAGKLEPVKAQAVVEAEAKKMATLTKEAGKKSGEGEADGEKDGEAEGEAEADGEKDGEDSEAMRAGEQNGTDGTDAEDEDEGEGEDEPGKSTIHIKHEEKRVKTAASARAVRDLEKALAESKRENAALAKKLAEADLKALVESGMDEDFARSLMALPAAQRKVMRHMAGMIESAQPFGGATMRGGTRESKPGDGFMRLLEAGLKH